MTFQLETSCLSCLLNRMPEYRLEPERGRFARAAQIDLVMLTACALMFTPREHTGFARVAHEGCGMRASTHWAIVGSAWLERTQRLAFGWRDGRGRAE